MEMGVDDGPERVGRLEAGKQFPSDPGRHSDHRCRVVAEPEGAALEIEGDGARPHETNFEHAFAEADRGAPRGEEGERRIDEALRKPMARNERMARPSPCAERLAQQPGGESGGAFRRVGVQAGKQERTPQARAARNIRAAPFRARAFFDRTATMGSALR